MDSYCFLILVISQFTLSHPEMPKLHRVLAFLGVIGVNKSALFDWNHVDLQWRLPEKLVASTAMSIRRISF